MLPKKIALYSLLYLLLLSSCENKLQEIQDASQLGKDNPEIGKDIEITYSDSAVIKAKLYAPTLKRIQRTKDPYTEFPDGLKIEFYQEDTLYSTLTANYGINYDSKQLTEVRNDVIISTVKQEKLNTEKLFWNQKTKKIYTDQAVKIATPKETIFGTGLDANQDFSHYRIRKFSGVIQMPN